ASGPNLGRHRPPDREPGRRGATAQRAPPRAIGPVAALRSWGRGLGNCTPVPTLYRIATGATNRGSPDGQLEIAQTYKSHAPKGLGGRNEVDRSGADHAHRRGVSPSVSCVPRGTVAP